MKIENIYFETIVSCSDFYDWIDANEDELGFNKDDFHGNMTQYFFDEGVLSSRYDQDFCQKVIDGGGGEYWDNARPYYPAILLFMQDYELQKIRFNADF